MILPLRQCVNLENKYKVKEKCCCVVLYIYFVQLALTGSNGLSMTTACLLRYWICAPSRTVPWPPFMAEREGRVPRQDRTILRTPSELLYQTSRPRAATE